MEENKEFEDIALDDFNFDFELATDNEDQEKSANEEVNNDFTDLSMEDFNFDEFVNDVKTNDDARQEPFFEQPEDDVLMQDDVNDFQIENITTVDEDVVEGDNPFVVDVPVQVSEEKENFESEIANVDIVSQESLREESTKEEEQTEIFENVLVDESAVEEEKIFEENLVDEVIAEEQVQDYSAMDNDVDITPEEAEAAHGEYFAQEDEITTNADNALISDYVPTSFVKSIEESGNLGYLKWYSGLSSDKVFEFGRDSDSATFNATDDCKTIHVNVGYDTYGWEVQFSDGVVMNLHDVREYQMRNGCLPNSEGRIIYGQISLMFSGVERILIYERVRYFSYGV